MKCISIRQPWAWLIAAGYKDIENRSWATKFRGECFIHASQGMTKAEYFECVEIALKINPRLSNRIIPSYGNFKRGGIIGKFEIYDVVTQSNSPWFFGPIGWRVRNAMHFSQLHPIKGQLSLFEVPTEFVYHEEQIICPMCEELQMATVEHTVPWFSLIHECSKCGYIIMESEWQAAPTKQAGEAL